MISHRWIGWSILWFAVGLGAAVAQQDPTEYPEQDRVAALLMHEPPGGVLFLVMEQDEEALTWVLPRLLHYTRQIRRKWPDLPVAVLSHGAEMMGLLEAYRPLYPRIHEDFRQLVEELDAVFHVCGAYAALSDLTAADFPDLVDVVPFGPAEIENYRGMDFAVVSVELSW